MRSLLRHRNVERLRVDDVRVVARKTLCLVGADDGAVRLFDGGPPRPAFAEFGVRTALRT
jgi:hypothetical protein